MKSSMDFVVFENNMREKGGDVSLMLSSFLLQPLVCLIMKGRNTRIFT